MAMMFFLGGPLNGEFRRCEGSTYSVLLPSEPPIVSTVYDPAMELPVPKVITYIATTPFRSRSGRTTIWVATVEEA